MKKKLLKNELEIEKKYESYNCKTHYLALSKFLKPMNKN
jgi:hypothetical protein